MHDFTGANPPQPFYLLSIRRKVKALFLATVFPVSHYPGAGAVESSRMNAERLSHCVLFLRVDGKISTERTPVLLPAKPRPSLRWRTSRILSTTFPKLLVEMAVLHCQIIFPADRQPCTSKERRKI